MRSMKEPNVVVAQGTECRRAWPGGPIDHAVCARRRRRRVAAGRADVLVLAAGGIADGRGIAAALMLGADGAVRWEPARTATQEAIIHSAARAEGRLQRQAMKTIRARVYDVVRRRDWPRKAIPDGS